ncbi:MAG: cysteine--tRNA ligase [Candidatus Aenigmarchaeota archaeon]|nr:cysteine--tRNA ligase [Candidatus Aenigmarchaeota archaeon]MDW8149016.1 cysteine--tRNA ligase [Candidatus Aenigmarchaeota archaeon]
MFKIYNTLTKKIEEFKPIENNIVKFYACGPTVYDFAHIGNLRAYVAEDLLRRVLELNGYKVIHVMNITDVGHLTSQADEGEDKVEMSARKERKTAWEIAEFYTKAFLEDIEKLNIKKPSVMPRATEHIKEMIEIVKKLMEKGYTYFTSDGIYFDTSKFQEYGKLTGMDFKRLNRYLKVGARVPFSKEKRNITDFALWKFSPKDVKRQMEWDFIIEKDKVDLEKVKDNPNIKIEENFVNLRGFPGWHIECSAMSMKYLGETFDIHAGGIDHIPIHHTNEIAQSESYTGKKFVNYWFHVNFLVVEGKKMSKSLCNFYTLKDLLNKGYSWREIRYLLIQTHYRKKLNFSFRSLDAAKKTVEKLRDIIIKIKQVEREGEKTLNIEEIKSKIFESLNNDLDISSSLSHFWKFLKSIKITKISKIDAENVINLILWFDQILGLKLDEFLKEEIEKEALELIKEREKLRKEGKFEEADKIRELLKEKYKIIVEDTESGTIWRKF